MKQENFNKYYVDEYLTSGKTRDNFVFLGCSDKFMDGAKRLLSKDNFSVKSCIFTLTDSEEKCVARTLDLCSSDLQKKLLARDYVCTKIMYNLLYGQKGKEAESQIFSDGIKAILCGDIKGAKSFHLKAPFQHDIAEFNKSNKIELNMFLTNTSNVYLQQAINNFLSSREPYSIKVFTTNKNFATYYDQSGNLIMSPDDYMTKNPIDMLQNIGYDNLLLEEF